ncbi:MAG: hypothetical protein H7126_03490 [Candidatus Parcubacteria bacterium]|nr:hypothetical protein [Leptolyngbyaceae cyanobacterium LF-bin-113]
MSRLTFFFKSLRLKEILTVFLAGFVILLSTGLQVPFQLIADSSIKANSSDLIYSGSNVPDSDRPDIGAKQQKSLPSLPNQKQPVLKRSDPDAKILERVGEAFKDATSFVKDTADSASARPEAKANPALGQ